MSKKRLKEVKKLHYIQNVATREDNSPKFAMLTESEYNSLWWLFKRYNSYMRVYKVRVNKENHAYKNALRDVKRERDKILKERKEGAIVIYDDVSTDKSLRESSKQSRERKFWQKWGDLFRSITRY